MALDPLTTVLIVIFAGITVIPAASRRLHVPVVVAEILLGIAVGVSWLDLVPDHGIVQFFSSFGLTYLMFLAGLEVDVEIVRRHLRPTATVALVSILVPFLAGVALAGSLGVNPLLLGTIFSTTSLSLVLPLTREITYDGEVLSILLGSVVLVDILSIFLLGVVLALQQGSLELPFLYSLVAVLTLFLIPWLVRARGIRAWMQRWLFQRGHFEDAVRFSFALIFLLGALSQELGFHSIIGSFVAGLIISEITPRTSNLQERLESFGYGFFIPMFFIFVGAKVNLGALFSNLESVATLAGVLTVAIAAKVASVTVAARSQGLTGRESLAFGFFHSARVSLIIAAVEVAAGLGLLSNTLFSTFILLAVVSALVGPSVGRAILLWNGREPDARAPAALSSPAAEGEPPSR